MNGDVTTLPPGSVTFPPTPESPGNTMQITTATVQPAGNVPTSGEYTALSDPTAVGVTAANTGAPGEVLFATSDTGTLGSGAHTFSMNTHLGSNHEAAPYSMHSRHINNASPYSMQPSQGQNTTDSIGPYSMQLSPIPGRGSNLLPPGQDNTQYAMHEGGLLDSMEYPHAHPSDIQGLDNSMHGAMDGSDMSLQGSLDGSMHGLDGAQISMQTLDGSQMQGLDGVTVSMQNMDGSTSPGTMILSDGDYTTQLIPTDHLVYSTNTMPTMPEGQHQVASMYSMAGGGESVSRSADHVAGSTAGHMTGSAGGHVTGSGVSGAPTLDDMELLYQTTSDMSGSRYSNTHYTHILY